MLLPPNSTLFISDLHLSEQSPALTELFLAFIRGPASQAEALYILGDFFDVWVGEDLHTHFHTRLMQGLQVLTDKHIPVYFMPGNRDFLISAEFLKQFKMMKLSDRVVIDLHGEPTLLMHGDLLCTDDIAYQRYRKFVHFPLIRAFFLSLPKRMRQSIANRLRSNSQRYQRSKPIEILDVTETAVVGEMKKAKVHQLIHGHVHRCAIHDFEIHRQPAQRAVLGDWHDDRGSVIIASPGLITLADFTQDHTLEERASFELP